MPTITTGSVTSLSAATIPAARVSLSVKDEFGATPCTMVVGKPRFWSSVTKGPQLRAARPVGGPPTLMTNLAAAGPGAARAARGAVNARPAAPAAKKVLRSISIRGSLNLRSLQPAPARPEPYLLMVTVTSPIAGVFTLNESPGLFPGGTTKQVSSGFIALVVQSLSPSLRHLPASSAPFPPCPIIIVVDVPSSL